MVDPSSEDDGILREWAPLSNLLAQIPPKAQRGLFTGDLNLTCIAALPDYLAIGTNHGLVYWYDRRTNELQRLRCENTICAITSISVISTVDYMIAAGTSNGVVSVFLIPKASPDNIPEIFKAKSKKQIERYTVGDLHSAPVSAIEWSPNGMKLFSGDEKGAVVLTEIDFYMHLSKSTEILNEKYEIVQLSYNSSNQLLLISTVCRTILCRKSESGGTWKVSQVGNKERKIMGRMGATFFNNPENPRSPVAYCSRPGLRLWTANKEGVVERTLIYKEAVVGQHPLIQLLNPTKSRGKHSRGEPQLGPLLIFKDSLLLTYTSDSLLILDPNTISVVAALYDVQKISALCVSKSEIFILEGERHLIRIGFTPDSIPTSAVEDSSSAERSMFASQFLELTAKIREASITTVIPIKKLSPIFSSTKSSGSSDGEQISECLEALELPPVLSLDTLNTGAADSVPELQVSSLNPLLPSASEKEVYTKAQRSNFDPQSSTSLHSELLEQISKEQFEEVVFKPKKKKKVSKRGVSATGTESGSDSTSVVSTTSENEEIGPNERLDTSSGWSGFGMKASRKPSVDEQSRVGDHFVKPGVSTDHEHFSSGDRALDLESKMEETAAETATESIITMPPHKPESFLNIELRNDEEISKALADKERLLAKKYNLEEALGIKNEEGDASENVTTECQPFQPSPYVGAGRETGTFPMENSEQSSLQLVGESKSLKSVSESSECLREGEITSTSNNMSDDPTSENRQLLSQLSAAELDVAGVKEEVSSPAVSKEAIEASGWLLFNTPKPVVAVAVCSYYLAAVDNHDSVHYCSLGGFGLKWQRADCKATQLAISPLANCVWRLHNDVAYSLKNPATSGPHGDEWVEAEKNVRNVAVGEDVAWLITQDGEILCQKGLSKDFPTSESIKVNRPCDWPAAKIVCFSQVVWLLTSGEVYERVGVSSAKPEGIDWRRVNIPVPGSVVDICLGSQRTGWIVDNSNTVMFSVDYTEIDPHWWQVLISDFIFQHTTTSPLQKLRSKISMKSFWPGLPGHCSPSSCIASGKDSVWILPHNSSTLHANKTKITGHSWSRIKLNGFSVDVRWQSLTAEGIFESGGQIWLLSVNGDLFCAQPYKNKKLKQISMPSSDGAVCLAASSQALWLLSSSGAIYIRRGLSGNCLEGNDWTQLSLMQIEDVHLSHVSCGLDVVWACDTVGNMHMTVISPHAMATATFSPVWIRVPDTKEQKKIFFIKVFAGPQTYMVWALDYQGKVYVREAIFPDYPLGADWVAVTGITAVDLSVSATAVWALSMEGDVYRRQGITQTNYIGDYWEKIPGTVEALTASMCDRLWGIDKNGALLCHTQLTVSLQHSHEKTVTPKSFEVASIGEEGDWEVL